VNSLPLLPDDLAQLLAFVPRRGWDALEWRPLLAQLRRISVQLATRRGVRHLSASAASTTESASFAPAPRAAKALDALNSRQRRAAGDALLRFYFAQWRNPEGLFLDLRPTRFSWNHGRLYFQPNGLHTRLDDGFRLAMADLYRGFYAPDDELLEDAMHRLGFLHDDLDPADADELRALLRSHFGSSTTAQRFSIEEFKESFDALFEFFIDHDYRLPTDFVLVGFYLITLYLSLDRLGARHDVRRLCLDELG
jgi:predicted unusual protein kinase regulating ubiquinone biosynthesis (AarF/ABC1/UbiB family)